MSCDSVFHHVTCNCEKSVSTAYLRNIPFYRITRNTASSWQSKNFCNICWQNPCVSLRRICSFLIRTMSGSMQTRLAVSTRVSPSAINGYTRVRQSVQPFSFTSPLDIHVLFKVSLPPFPGGLLREFFNVKGNGNALWLLEIRLLICYCKLKLFVFKPQLFCFNSPTSQTQNPSLELTRTLGHGMPRRRRPLFAARQGMKVNQVKVTAAWGHIS